LTVDGEGTLRVELQNYEVGETKSIFTLIDGGGVYGGGLNASVPTSVNISVVDSVLLLKISIKITNAYDMQEMMRDAAAHVRSLLMTSNPNINIPYFATDSLKEDDWMNLPYLQIQRMQSDLRVYDLVCQCTSPPFRGSNDSTVISKKSPWAPENAVSFYVRVLLPDLNFSWTDRVKNGMLSALWNVSWVQHVLHSNCDNQPSFIVNRTTLVNSQLWQHVTQTPLFTFVETEVSSLRLRMRGMLTSVVAPQDVAIDADGNEMVIFHVRPIAHKLFARSQWTVDGTDGGMMESAPEVLATCNSEALTQAYPPRFRSNGECHEADLFISPKPFWNGRIMYNVSMRGSTEQATFEIQVLPVNQVPTLKLESFWSVNEDAGSVLRDVALNLSTAGPDIEDENQQQLTYLFDWKVGCIDMPDYLDRQGRTCQYWSQIFCTVSPEVDLAEYANADGISPAWACCACGGNRNDINNIVDLSTISIENASATLSFKTGLNANGILVGNVSLQDKDLVRGDSKTSALVTVHLVVLPVNDGKNPSSVLVFSDFAI
jgi:hypothetical protein